MKQMNVKKLILLNLPYFLLWDGVNTILTRLSSIS